MSRILAPVMSQPKSKSTDDARIAHFEKEENFRWIASFLATTSSVTLKERVPESIQHSIYSFAELAEIAHGSIDPSWILDDDNRRVLGATGFPLEHYPTLTGEIDGQMEHIKLVERFYGTRGTLQGYCCLRMQPRIPACDVSTAANELSKPRLPRDSAYLHLCRYDKTSNHSCFFRNLECETSHVRYHGCTCRLSNSVRPSLQIFLASP